MARRRISSILKLLLIVLALVLLGHWFNETKFTDYLTKIGNPFLIKREARQPNTYRSCKGPWENWYEQFHSKSLLHHNSSEHKNSRFLVYLCPGQSQGCGGLGNRLFGIVSLFYLAMLTNRVFLIHWGAPNKLEDFLQPNRINWKYDQALFQDLDMRRSYWGISGPSEIYDESRTEEYPKFLEWIEKENCSVILNQDVESIGTIWYFANKIWKNPSLSKRAKELGLPQSDDAYPYAMLGCAMNFLFKKSPYLKKELTRARRHLNIRPRPYIGIHIRTSDYHWGDKNPYSVRTKDPERVLACVRRVQALIQAKNRVGKRVITWFLAADKFKIKERWSKKFRENVVSLKRKPKHLEFSKKKGSFRDVLIDIFLLSESDFFIASWDSTFSYVVMGIRGFSTKSITYGERCNINETSLELAD